MSVKTPSLVRIILGRILAGALLFGVAVLINPLAGLALMLLITIALFITVGPVVQFLIAKRAAIDGSY
jgi:hypothetical protein